MLTTDDIATYHRDGVLVLSSLFTHDEILALRASFDRDSKVAGDHRIIEPQSDEVRALYASHLRQPEYAMLVRSPRLVKAAHQLLGSEVYLYQLKINAKPGHGGGGWAWHQDYAAWQIADDLVAPDLVNAVVFLDDVTQSNGPISFVPGSHADGLIRASHNEDMRSSQHLDPDDIALPSEALDTLMERRGVVTPIGKAGTVVFFHPEAAHGSTSNLSATSRRLAIATYNDVHNVPQPAGPPRPDYLVCRDTRPLPVQDDVVITEDA
jgi:ectoine hydroxylase